jgi:lipopolysaccharide export LptBFGC system permease protein LptF
MDITIPDYEDVESIFIDEDGTGSENFIVQTIEITLKDKSIVTFDIESVNTKALISHSFFVVINYYFNDLKEECRYNQYKILTAWIVSTMQPEKDELEDS